jgi:lipopolysaccharide export system permease protein
MPIVFIRWLLGRFVRNVAAMAVALTALLALFDMLANASAVAAGSGSPVVSLLFYVLLRLPAIGVFILPFAVLIAAVQTFASLAAQNEILALESAGFTLGRIVAVLAAGAVALAAIQFAIGDRVVTEVTARMNEWKASGYHGLPRLDDSPAPPAWFASENHIIRLGDVSQDGGRLRAPTIIETDSAGIATHYWIAEKAAYGEGGWTFEKAAGRDLKQLSQEHLAPPPRLAAMPPQALSSFSRPVEELHFSELHTLGWGDIAPQLHPPEYYRVWTNYRLAQPLGIVAMVLLAAPVCLQVQRNNSRRIFVSIGVFALGFLYFIAQGVLLAVGEEGGIPLSLAAWGSFAIFGGAGLAAIALRVK